MSSEPLVSSFLKICNWRIPRCRPGQPSSPHPAAIGGLQMARYEPLHDIDAWQQAVKTADFHQQLVTEFQHAQI